MKYMTQNLSNLCSIVDGTLQWVRGQVYLQKVNNLVSDHWAKITISRSQIQRGAFTGNLCMLPYFFYHVLHLNLEMFPALYTLG